MPKKGKNKKPKAKKPLASQSSDEQAKLLLECAKQGQIETAQKILEHGKVPTKAIDEAFLAGAEFGHIKVVSLVGSRVSSMMVANAKGETALSLAARNGHIDVAVLLLKIGHNIECRNHNGATPLFAAVEFNQEEMGVFLLERKANVNAVDNSRNSVLHVAAANGHSDIVLMILKAGGSTNVLNDKDETPLEVAKNAEICRIILEFHTGYGYDHGQDKNRAPQMAISPFRELPPGPASYLFWTAMGVGKDSYMFQNFGVYPFDRLNDTERIIVLTEVAEAMSGYKMDLKCNILNESALYAVFALMKARIKKELEDGEKDDDLESSYLWRKRVLEAYEQVYNTNGSLAGLSIECWQRSVWNTVVNLLARSLFGESFWEKKRMFLSPNALERTLLLKNYRVPEGYFLCKLPSTASIEIQLTFKKLITMSKTFLCDEPVRPSGCFCQDCIAELEVPITFKLQFLEEAAQEKRKNKKGRKAKDRKDNAKEEEANRRYVSENRRKLDELVLGHRKELKSFWSSISIEEKWCLTEMSTTELSDSISNAMHWETLRAALESYAKYAWEEDVLEITEDCVTIADDMCEEKGMHDMLEAMLDAVELTSVQQTPPTSAMTEDEWDKRGRQMLENLVLAEFARKIAAQYVLKKQESRAQQRDKKTPSGSKTDQQSLKVALELELELLHEEEQQLRAAEKKAKGKKKKARGKKKKKKKTNEAAEADGDDEDGDEEETPPSSSSTSTSAWTSVSAAASILRARGATGSPPGLTHRHPEKTLRASASTNHDAHRHAHPVHVTEHSGKSSGIHHPHPEHILKNSKGRTILPTGITTIRTTHDGKVISVVDSGIIHAEPKRIIRRKHRVLSDKKVERKLKLEKANLGENDDEEKAPSKSTSTKVLRQTKGQEKILGKERMVYRDSEDDEDDKRHDSKAQPKKDLRRQPRKGVEAQKLKEEKEKETKDSKSKDKKLEAKGEKGKVKCKKDPTQEKVQDLATQTKDNKEKEVKEVKEEGHKKKKGKKRKEEKAAPSDLPQKVVPVSIVPIVPVPQTEEVEDMEEVEAHSEEELSDNPLTPSSRNKRPSGRWAASTNTNNPFAMLTEDEPEEGYRPKGHEPKKRPMQTQHREDKESDSVSNVNKSDNIDEDADDIKTGGSTESKSIKSESKSEGSLNKGSKKSKPAPISAATTPATTTTQPSTWVAKTPPPPERTLPSQPKKIASTGRGKEEKEVKTPAASKKILKPAPTTSSQTSSSTSGTGPGPGSPGSTVTTIPPTVSSGGSATTTVSGTSGTEGTGNWWDAYQDGMMFICTKETYKECMELKLLGLPRQHLRVVRSLRPKTSALFLFNVSDRHLHGVYEATCAGQENMNPAAWARNKTYSRSSPFPAQIEFKIVQAFESIAESAFRHVFTDGNRIRKLDGRQVRDLIQIFRMRARAANRNRTGRARPNGPVTPVKRPAVPSITGGSAGPSGVKLGAASSTTASVATSATSTLNHSPKKNPLRAPVKNVWKLRAENAAAAAKKSQEKPSGWKTSPSLTSSNPESVPTVSETVSEGTTEEDTSRSWSDSTGQAETNSDSQSSVSSSAGDETWSTKEVSSDVMVTEASEVSETAQDAQPSEVEVEGVQETTEATEVEAVEQEQETLPEAQSVPTEEIVDDSSSSAVTYEAVPEETYDPTVSAETVQEQQSFAYEAEGTAAENPLEEQEEPQAQEYVDSHQEYEGLVQAEASTEEESQPVPTASRHTELISPEIQEPIATLPSPSETEFQTMETSEETVQYASTESGSQAKKNISLFWNWDGVWHSSSTPPSTQQPWSGFEPSTTSTTTTDLKASAAVRHVTWPPADQSRSSTHSHSETHYNVDPVSTSAGRQFPHSHRVSHNYGATGPTRFETGHSLDDSHHRRQSRGHVTHVHAHALRPNVHVPTTNSHTPGWRDPTTHSETSETFLPSLDYSSLEKSSFRSSLSLDYGTDFLNSSIWSTGYLSKGGKDTPASTTTFSPSLSSLLSATASGSSSTSSSLLGNHSKTFSTLHSGSVWGLNSSPGFTPRSGEKHSHTQNGW